MMVNCHAGPGMSRNWISCQPYSRARSQRRRPTYVWPSALMRFLFPLVGSEH